MPLAAPQKAAEEELGSIMTRSMSRATRRRASIPLATTPSSGSQRPRPSGSRSERSRKRKRTLADDGEVDSEKRRARPGADRGCEVEQQEEEVSSPLRVPYIPDVLVRRTSDGGEIYEPVDADTTEAYEQREAMYREKLDRLMELPTLALLKPSPLSDPKLLHLRRSGKRAILRSAKFVVGLSSTIGTEPLNVCSGLLIDCNEVNKTATILTSAKLICSKSPLNEWLGEEEYAPNAKVDVHLLDGTSVEGHLLYYQKHYNIALFNIGMDVPVQLPSFENEIKSSQEVFIVGRSTNLDLSISYGKVQFLNPNEYDRHHYVYIYGAEEAPKCEVGGPVVDLNGKVVGMYNLGSDGSFLPSSIILKCFHLWKRFQCIPRPHLGLKLWAIRFLDPIQIDRISRKCKISEGLIVEEVSAECVAEKLGVRMGDIIESFNGEFISSTIELEELLLRICEEHFDAGNDFSSKVNVNIAIFHISKGVRSKKRLTVQISNDAEVVVRGEYLVTTRESSRSNQ